MSSMSHGVPNSRDMMPNVIGFNWIELTTAKHDSVSMVVAICTINPSLEVNRFSIGCGFMGWVV